MNNVETQWATEDDIFADIRDLTHKVSDADAKERLSALVEGKKREFDRAYDDCRYRENGQRAYGVLRDFVTMIRSSLNVDDEESLKVADFMDNFYWRERVSRRINDK